MPQSFYLIDAEGNVVGDINPIRITQGSPGAGYAAGDDPSFVTGDSPAIIDLNAALSRNANLGHFTNTGPGDISVKISEDGTPTFGDAILLKNGDKISLDGANVDQLEVTWVADSSFYWFAK